MMNFDNQITTAINSLAGRYVTLDFASILLAKHVIFLLVLSIAVTWFVRTDRAIWRFRAISCGLAVAAGLLLNQGILFFVSRVRPYDLGLTHLIAEKSADLSFPSDHATVVFAIAFVLVLLRDRFVIPYLERDLLPTIRTILNWNFPIMIPVTGGGRFHEEVEVHRSADRLHLAAGRWPARIMLSLSMRRGLVKPNCLMLSAICLICFFEWVHALWG